METKYCKHCGEQIDADCIICPKCGKQVDEIKAAAPQVVINNSNANVNSNVNTITGGQGRPRNKWVALCLCLFIGFLGAHKFYEGKAGMGVLYIFTGGLFIIGVVIDFIAILVKPTIYYV